MKKHIDIVASDLDDTLLGHDLRISEKNIASLAKARDMGIRVVLASGRNIYSMAAYARQLGLDGPHDYMICSNGAEILRNQDGQAIYERKIGAAACLRIAEILDERQLAWQVYEGGRIFVSRLSEWTEADSRLTGQPCQEIGNPSDFLARGQLKFVVPGEPERLRAEFEYLSATMPKEVSLVFSKPYFLEIVSRDNDKGKALALLAERLGVPRERVMAIGDAPNDLGMVSWAGWGAAVGNACPEIRDAARIRVAQTNDQDAVSAILERLADTD